MLKQTVLILTLATCTTRVAGQNLVLNPSFEEYSSCPNQWSQITRSNGWYPERMTPDYFNSCSSDTFENGQFIASVPSNGFGYAWAASGNAYSGIIGAWYGGSSMTECVGTQLISPLQIGTKYFVSFKLFLAQKANLANWCGINRIGALFSTIQYDSINTVSLCNCPQVYSNSIITDTLNWTTITGSFVADSSYYFLGVGRFFDDPSTSSIQIAGIQCNAYYYLDDICVSTDSLFSYNYSYTEINNIINENYSVVCFPNPFHNTATLQFDNSKKHNCVLTLYNMQGQLMRTIAGITTDKVEIERLNLATGLYFFLLRTDRQIISTGKVAVE